MFHLITTGKKIAKLGVLPKDKSQLLPQLQHQPPSTHSSNLQSSAIQHISPNASPLLAASATQKDQAVEQPNEGVSVHSQPALTCNQRLFTQCNMEILLHVKGQHCFKTAYLILTGEQETSLASKNYSLLRRIRD